MKKEDKPLKITRRQALKLAGAAAAGIAATSVTRRLVGPSKAFAESKPKEAAPEFATTEAERKELAQKYKCAKPGEKFGFGHITWHLAQEYAIMNYQSQQQAAEQLGLKFMGAVATTDSEWLETARSYQFASAILGLRIVYAVSANAQQFRCSLTPPNC